MVKLERARIWPAGLHSFLLWLALFSLAVDSAMATIDAGLQMQLGNPSNATSNTNNHDHYLIQRPVETLDYSDALGEPNWASWDLTTNDLGSSGRSNFAVDTNLPPNFYHVGTSEYSGSGYDRGHLCPSADRTSTTNFNDLVFFMSNMMPQAPDNNSGVWKNFEEYCRSLVQSNNYELLIQCGPGGFTGARINTNGHVAIPQFIWKIVVVLPPGTNGATNRITTTNRVICIKVPNTNGVSTAWQNFITSATQIQVDTGLTFFTTLPGNVAAVLRNKVDGQTNAPPLIYGFTPASGEVNGSVIITGTNFNSVSAVSFGGVTAAFSRDSGSQLTAVVPTNASSGLISVTTPAGTTVSSNFFTVLNPGVGVYSGVLAGWDVNGLAGGLNNYGASPFMPATNAPNLMVTGLTRGASVKQSGTAAAGGWGGTGFTSAGAANAIAANQFVTFGLTVSNGYTLSFASVARFDYFRSPSGPTNGLLQYQVGGGPFTDLANLTYSAVSSGEAIGVIDLSGITALQNVGASTPVIFRIVNFGGTSSSGTWYIYNTAGTLANDLAISGTIKPVSPAAPTLGLRYLSNQQFQCTVAGTAGSIYILQATTNLNSPYWVSLLTNTAPFTFTQSNVIDLPQRFYRGVTP